MRRLTAALIVPLLAGLAVAGCGSSGSSDPNQNVSVSGTFGKAPKVQIPTQDASKKLAISTAIKGSGTQLPSSDSVLANVAIYLWSGTKHKLLTSTFTQSPALVPANVGLKGLADAIKGAKPGSRVLAVLPPAYAYGTSGNSQLGVKKNDTTVWVIDVIKGFAPTASATGSSVSSGGGALPTVKASPGTAPVITVPKTSPPTSLIIKTLNQGTGPAVQSGQTVIMQYVASIWRTGQVFNSTWPSAGSAGQLFTYQAGSQGLIPGFVKGLSGAKVGDRLMIVIPPAQGYGKAGQAQAGIKGTDTLVFVVDVLAAVPSNAA